MGFVALAGAGVALKPAAVGSKSLLSVVPTQAQSDVQPPPSGEPVAASSGAGGSPMKDSAPPDHKQVGSPEAGINAPESTPTTSAAIDAQRPAESPNAVVVGTPAETPALASAATGSASAASQAAGGEPVRSAVVRQDRTASARITTDTTSPSETPKPHTVTTTSAGAKAASSKSSSTKIDVSATPNVSKKSVREIVAKGGKATAGAMADVPKPPLSPVQPEKTVTSPTPQAATDPVAAAPAAPTTPITFATQSVGQLTHAFVYLTQLPVALIQHARDPNTEAK